MTILAGSAAATDKFQYNVQIRPIGDIGTPNGRVIVQGLLNGQSHTVRVLRASVQQYTQTAPGGTIADVPALTVAGGDQIEVQQPTGSVVETYTVPDVSLSGTPGSPVVSGRAPDGTSVNVRYTPSCYADDGDVFAPTPSGGAFSATYPRPLLDGGILSVTVYPGKGDQISYASHVPGETICIFANAFFYPDQIGQTPSATPYHVNASELRKTVATGARLVLRRADVIMDEASDPSTASSVSLDTAIEPSAGDVVEVYRPAGATTPSATFPIPSVKSIYDPSNDLLAIDAPAASVLGASVGTIYGPGGSDYRATRATALGRTIFNFALSQGTQPPVGLASMDAFQSTWVAPDTLRRFSVISRPGDLNPPALQLKLASKFKSKSSIKVAVTANEAVSAKLSLTLPATLKKPKSKKAKKSKATKPKKPKPPTLVASRAVVLPAGTTKVKLTLTKAGKKLFKKFHGKHYPSQKATVTVVATDAGGNVSTTVKTTKLVIQ
jgi:hypothetical protein